jgi:UDP-N-acetyl-alpha-D-quinovosamine dehydrogenase
MTPPPESGPIVVTGGTGFLGRAIVRQLHAHGFRVRVLARTARGAESPGDDIVCADVRDETSVSRAVEGAAGVVHAAGLAHVFADADRAPFHEINVTGTEVVARAAARAGVGTLAVVSSVAVYGVQAERHEDRPPQPADAYGASKADAERAAQKAFEGVARRLVVLRLGTLYGEGDRGNVQRLLNAIDGGRFVPIGAARNRKSLLHVEDAARACILPLLMPDGPAGTFNVAGSAVVMRDVIGGLSAALGRTPPRWHVPIGLARAGAAGLAIVRPSLGSAIRRTLGKWTAEDVYPCERFERAYGFRPAIAWEDGVRRQVEWWRQTRGAAIS